MHQHHNDEILPYVFMIEAMSHFTYGKQHLASWFPFHDCAFIFTPFFSLLFLFCGKSPYDHPCRESSFASENKLHYHPLLILPLVYQTIDHFDAEASMTVYYGVLVSELAIPLLVVSSLIQNGTLVCTCN